MTARYRLPDILGGGEIEAVETWGGCAGGRPEYDLGDGITILAPKGQPLDRVGPPEPPLGSVVLVAGGSPTDLNEEGETLGVIYRRHKRGWMLPGDSDHKVPWSDLCAYPHPPTVLVPAPEPVTLPWRVEHKTGVLGAEVFVRDGTVRIGVLGTHIGVTAEEARDGARALWTAADAAEATP